MEFLIDLFGSIRLLIFGVIKLNTSEFRSSYFEPRTLRIDVIIFVGTSAMRGLVFYGTQTYARMWWSLDAIANVGSLLHMLAKGQYWVHQNYIAKETSNKLHWISISWEHGVN